MKKKFTNYAFRFFKPGVFSDKQVRTPSMIKLITMILILVIITPFAHVVKAGNTAPWQRESISELIEKRTRTVKHFQRTDGKISAIVSSGSIHYMENGSWNEISNEILPNASSTHPYASVHNAVKNFFPANPFVENFVMDASGIKFFERVSSIQFRDQNGSIVGALPLGNNITVNVNGNSITYSGFYPNVNLVYHLSNDSRKFDLQINSASFFSGIPQNAKFITIVESFTSDKNMTVENGSSDAEVIVNGESILGFAAPVAFDNNSDPEKMLKGNFEFSANEDGYTLATSFSLAWLRNPARTFPLHLDPTVNYYPQSASMWTGYQTSNANKTNGIVRVATTGAHAWAKFDISGLPSSAVVSAATYYGYHYSQTGVNKVCEIRGLGTVDPVPTAAGPLYTQITTGPVYSNNYIFGGASFQWRPGALGGSVFTDIVAAIPQGWFGLGIVYSSGHTPYMYQYGHNAGNPNDKPYIEIVYTTTPCFTTPDANTIVGPTQMLCPGQSATLNLSTTYTVGGIEYEWWESTATQFGPFTQISNATAAELVMNGITASKWVVSVITCSNTLQSYTTAAAMLQVQGTTTNNVPYHESFETLTLNDLPNCSWSATGMGSSTDTYQSQTTNNRVPKSGNGFAAFAASPAGTNYFYSNGIWLEPGITYSAALWYITESGFNNWTELAIGFGMAQSPNGITTIASTAGMPTPVLYTLLSDTFEVAVPGLYYISVKATSASGVAPYLSWDDLSITIPCQFNSPPLNIFSPTSPTVCGGSRVNITASGASSYTWNTGDNSASVAPNVPQVASPTSTVYEVTGIKSISGCTTSLTYSFHIQPSPQIVISTNNPVTCMGQSVILTAHGALNYNWSHSINTATTVVWPQSISVYSVSGTNSYGCYSIGSIQLNPVARPSIFGSSSSYSICSGEAITLSASGGATYLWIASNGAMFTGQQVTITPVSSVIYSVNGTDANGCSNESSFIVGVDECSGITENESAGTVKVFPNPSSGLINIESGANATVMVIDMLGKQVIVRSVSSPLEQIDISDLSAGIYTIRVMTGTTVSTVRIQKQ